MNTEDYKASVDVTYDVHGNEIAIVGTSTGTPFMLDLSDWQDVSWEHGERWYIKSPRPGTGSVVRSGGRLPLHHAIMKPRVNERILFKDKNPMNCTRNNLIVRSRPVSLILGKDAS